ncbi:hypothetical protein GCM10009721_11630 [Terrabacter tumescens]|uniref:HNH nuclease domain-containing protein n=1 Tax=Terrabacter tumescens TaxID=60443 RepID=A0ABQ2HS51_9MICO|nr:hypothetical protein GCM10009721_11630 [Terrabacter tumescens]
MLELLRSRLADLEARQRTTGGTSARDFWERFTGSSASSADESCATAGAGAGKGRGRARRVAPESRPVTAAHGPWAGWSVESLERLEALDPDTMRPLTEAEWREMIDDPAWIEAVEEQAEAHAAHDAAHGSDDVDGSRVGACGDVHGGACGQSDRVDAVALDALVGYALDRHASADLTAAAELIARQRRNHEVMLVTVVSELVARGVEAPDGLSRADWLRSHDASLTAGQAKSLVAVGTALADPRWSRLRLLVTTQQVAVANAAQIVDFDTRTSPVADVDDLRTAIDDLTDQARQLRPEELSRLVRHHTEQVRPPRDEDALDRGRRDARGLWFTQPNATGMVGLRGVLDPEGAAILKSAIDPLSIPRPEKDDRGRTIAPDERTPARRRMDALLEMVQRGVASAAGVATTDKAKIVVLIELDDLLADVNGDIPEAFRRKRSAGKGSGNGSCTTLTGDVLSPAVVRRMACDAEIIPMVLGSDGEPLDVGRRRRLFTRGQRLALGARDKGCSWTGCTVPAGWCDAHHVVHWRHGGRTSLLNAALLCPKHHTEVHDRELTATVTPLGVTWHT